MTSARHRLKNALVPRATAAVTLAAVALAAGCGGSATPPPPPGPTCQEAPQGGSCMGLVYSCTGGATPAAASYWNCSPTANGDGTTSYCCVSPTCTPDASQQACGAAGPAGSVRQSYTCPAGGVMPIVQDGTLCTAQPSNPDGTVPYCCTDFDAIGCEPTSGLLCPYSSRAFTCTGANQPTAADPSLLCGPPDANPDGTNVYCCGPNSCTNLGTASGCNSNATAYDCVGYSRPDAPGSTCTSIGQYTTDDPNDRFCCMPGPCVELDYFPSQPTDPKTQCAESQGTPYGCTGATTPAASDPTIYCDNIGAGEDNQTDYCCRKSGCGYVQFIDYCDPPYAAAISCTGSAMPSSLSSSLNSCVVAPTQPGDVPDAIVYCCKT